MTLPPDAIANGELAARQRRERARAAGPFLDIAGPTPRLAPPEGFNDCANPECQYLVPRSVAYCCWGCGNAHEHHYEIHEDGLLGHDERCSRRSR